MVNAGELLAGLVGKSEENMRNLFKAAKEEEEKKGPDSRLFVIIFDEFDAIGMQRGAGRGDTGVGVRLQCTIAVYDCSDWYDLIAIQRVVTVQT